MVGGSSCFHPLRGLFALPRNKVVPAGLRVGQAVFSGLAAVQGGDGLSMLKPLRLLSRLHNLPD